MKSFEDVRALTEGLGSDYFISASKLLGQPVVDAYLTIGGYGDPCFMLHSLVLADGTTIGTQGEHDEVFLEDYNSRPELSPEQAEAIYDELNPEEDD